MEKTYAPEIIEKSWYKNWESLGYFKPEENKKDNYSIVIPPPNVTGSLHMGHAFQDTIMDALIRYNRMLGKSTLWQPGTDHAGIATQIVVERKVEREEGKTKHDYGRDAFIDKIWEWKKESGGNISKQLKRLGASADWSRERFTMDDGLSAAVQDVFIKLYEEGLIYRGKRLVNWDPVLKTAISDLEVINEEENGHMYHVKYPFVKGQGHDSEFIHIATTRPETILADGAIAVHPDDERYKDVIGKLVHVPMTERVIPIIADEYPDPNFGTGCVKITPAHDFNDYAVGQRHEMEVINLFTDDAKMNDSAPKEYQGMDRFVARDKIVNDLKEAGLLEGINPHKIMRPRGDRTNAVIEPYLTNQWYVKATDMAKPAIDAVRSGNIKFVPKQYENMYFSWMNNIQDWCISRQLWWGHRIPAWYDEYGNVYVGKSEVSVRNDNNISSDVNLYQDNDVLDTWFSSALWTFSTMGWPEKNKFLEKFHPTNVLVTGFDIIFFWVARMIMMTLHFLKNEDGTKQVPFNTVYVTGLIRDENGQKMSKSKGNVLDPLDMIDGISLGDLLKKRTANLMNQKQENKIVETTKKTFPDGIPAYGTDALRFTLASLASNGRDINWDMKRLEGYRNFCNKLWNAARFVVMQCKDKPISDNLDYNALRAEEMWVLSSMQDIIKKTHQSFEEYRFDIAANDLYHFTWDTYCSWYIELAKAGLNNPNLSENVKANIRKTLIYTLSTSLKLLHPIMPFITEEIWQQIKPLTKEDDESIMITSFPIFDDGMIFTSASKKVDWLRNIINSIRKVRSEMDVSPSKGISILVELETVENKEYFEEFSFVLKKLTNIKTIDFCTKEKIPESAFCNINGMKLHIPLAGLIDKDAELSRLSREIEKAKGNVDKFSNQLKNEQFISKAPEALVAKTKKLHADALELLNSLEEQKKQIENIIV